MAQRTKFNAAVVIKKVDAEAERRMSRCVILVQDTVKRLINRGNPTGKDPSLPGEPPKKVSTRLFQSIASAVRRESRAIVGRVGTNVIYARRLELGFVGTDSLGRSYNQKPRPAFRPALEENRPVIQKAFGVR